jgi:hypothetical protein
MAPTGAISFECSRLLVRGDLGWCGIENKAACGMTNHDGHRDEHYHSGHAAEDEAEKSQSRTIRHNTSLKSHAQSLPADKTLEPGKRFNRTAINLVA